MTNFTKALLIIMMITTVVFLVSFFVTWIPEYFLFAFVITCVGGIIMLLVNHQEYQHGWNYGADYNFSFTWEDCNNGGVFFLFGYLNAHMCRYFGWTRVLGWK